MARTIDSKKIAFVHQGRNVLYLWFTYRTSKYSSGYDVHGHFRQPDGVLRGQTIKRFIDAYPTVEAALAAYPDAKGGSVFTDAPVSLNHLPGENDPVPGGMYPDDWS